MDLIISENKQSRDMTPQQKRGCIGHKEDNKKGLFPIHFQVSTSSLSNKFTHKKNRAVELMTKLERQFLFILEMPT